MLMLKAFVEIRRVNTMVNIREKIKRTLESPYKSLFKIVLNSNVILHHIPDIMYLKLAYRSNLGKKLDLKNPKTFNEKLQWLKIHNRIPNYINMVDKYEAKKYVAEIIGNKYIIPTLGIWNHFDEIDFEKLPDQFVLKCTHDSGSVIICKDKSALNKKLAKEKLERSLKENYFWTSREWPYKNVKPRIIAEKFIGDNIQDYKFFCFAGEPKIMYITTDRGKSDVETKFDFFDMNFNHLPFINGHPNVDHKIQKPSNFEKMQEIAKKLSEGIIHVRVDFYDVKGEIYFGELTFFHWSGFVAFNPEDWDYILGEWIKLPIENNS